MDISLALVISRCTPETSDSFFLPLSVCLISPFFCLFSSFLFCFCLLLCNCRSALSTSVQHKLVVCIEGRNDDDLSHCQCRHHFCSYNYICCLTNLVQYKARHSKLTGNSDCFFFGIFCLCSSLPNGFSPLAK